ncbi:MAG: hypothetical protein H6966_00595 [Chromatiaceae bacterium]|nr:hypothetical protein [Chromatiaceae bacterium]
MKELEEILKSRDEFLNRLAIISKIVRLEPEHIDKSIRLIQEHYEMYDGLLKLAMVQQAEELIRILEPVRQQCAETIVNLQLTKNNFHSHRMH